MTILDDSVLALIARFVVDDLETLSISDEHFLKQQIMEVKNHIEHVSGEDRHKVIFEWIKNHAEQYRKQWHSKTLTQMLSHKRCSDCPLIDGEDDDDYCGIHHRWLKLLKDYLSGKVESGDYVEQTLEMLDQHKQQLKISRIAVKLA